MDKKKAIKIIEQLYPADSASEVTKKTGRDLLTLALFENWRGLPEAVLARYAQLCIEENEGF